ncbi:MAG: PLP-dependent aminotransferase family protein [Terriglobales bacterium]
MTTFPPRRHYLPPLAVTRTRGTSLAHQIYAGLQQAMTSGQLRAGQPLPSTRALAAELRVSRMPVLEAFARLHAEGYIEALRGSGTRVAALPAAGAAPPLSAGAGRARPRTVSRAAARARQVPPQPWHELRGAFRACLPALDHFPVALWARLVARNARALPTPSLAYGDPMGYAPFRAVLAEYLRAARGVRCEAGQIMTVAGSQQGLQLAARVLVNPGDTVWIEEPGYSGAQHALAAAGARLVPVPVDQDGLRVEEGIRRAPRARAVYITPSHQFPLGTTMSARRRLELLQWAARAGAWVIEDDYDSEYRFGAHPLPALQGLDAAARVIYLGTCSKVLAPALRVGYLVLPPDLVDAFARVRDGLDIFPSPLVQAALADFIREGHFARHLRRMRGLYQERYAVLAEELAHRLGPRQEVVSAPAGMHLCVLLPPGSSDLAVAHAGVCIGLALQPLSLYYLRRPRAGLVLGFGTVAPAEIRARTADLARLLGSEVGRSG